MIFVVEKPRINVRKTGKLWRSSGYRNGHFKFSRVFRFDSVFVDKIVMAK